MARSALLLALLLATPVAHATEWTAFRWEGFGAFPHAALMLPAKVDGVACFVQLDTGANGRFMPSGRAVADAPGREVAIEIGQHTVTARVPQAVLAALPAVGDCHAGTVGNAFFDNGSLILDLKHARFAYSNEAILRDDSAAAPIKYVHQQGWDGGHIVVPITLPGQPPQEAMFDSGAALFTFTPFKQSLYEALRGADSQPLSAPSWGNEISCQTSRLTTPLRVSQYTLDSGILGHCKMEVGIGVPLAGIVGLAGFADQTITIDYPSRKWKVTR